MKTPLPGLPGYRGGPGYRWPDGSQGFDLQLFAGGEAAAKAAHVSLHSGVMTELSLVMDTHDPRNPDARVLTVKSGAAETPWQKLLGVLGVRKADTLPEGVTESTLDETKKSWLVSVEVDDDIDGDGDGAEDYTNLAYLLLSAASDLRQVEYLNNDAVRAASVVACIRTFRTNWASLIDGGEVVLKSAEKSLDGMKLVGKAGARNSKADKAKLRTLKDGLATLTALVAEIEPGLAAEPTTTKARVPVDATEPVTEEVRKALEAKGALLVLKSGRVLNPGEAIPGDDPVEAVDIVQPAAVVPAAAAPPAVAAPAAAPPAAVAPPAAAAPAVPPVAAAAPAAAAAAPAIPPAAPAAPDGLTATGIADLVGAAVKAGLAEATTTILAAVDEKLAPMAVEVQKATGARTLLDATVEVMTEKARAQTGSGAIATVTTDGSGAQPPPAVQKAIAGGTIAAPKWANESPMAAAFAAIQSGTPPEEAAAAART